MGFQLAGTEMYAGEAMDSAPQPYFESQQTRPVDGWHLVSPFFMSSRVSYGWLLRCRGKHGDSSLRVRKYALSRSE